MNRNGNSSVVNNNNTKKIQFDLNKSVQVTKVFARENHALTKNETIFMMVDTDHPGKNLILSIKNNVISSIADHCLI